MADMDLTTATRLGIGLLCGSLLACSDSFTPRDGLYFGPRISFRVSAGQVSDIRLFGVECRVPHPENEALALCLERAPGWISGTVAIEGSTFSASLEEVGLAGTFSADALDVQGTWTFETSCKAGGQLPCVAEGQWQASWQQELQPQPDVDTGAPDSASGPDDSGSAADTSPTGPPDVPSDHGPLGNPPPAGVSDGQEAAQHAIEQRRQRSGVGSIAMDEALNLAAQNHADYYSAHADKYASSGLNPHSENPDWPQGYTGAGLGERLSYAGVVMGGGGSYEVMAFSSTTEGAIDGWMATLYHRIPLIHPNAERWGYGEVLSGARVQVGDVVYANTTTSGPAYWPPPDANGVDTSWGGYESPQPPLPAGESYPSGPVITVSFPLGEAGTLSTATLKDKASGQSIPIMVRDPSNDSWLSSTWAMYSLDPLEPSTTYIVSFEGSQDVSWEFTTAP